MSDQRTEEKNPGLVLLDRRHLLAKPCVVGWEPTTQGYGSLYNPRGFATLRVVHTNAKDRPLYDQTMLVEAPGAIVVAEDDVGRICLVRQFRKIAPRLYKDAGADYIARLEANRDWERLVATAGQWIWEVPRGIIEAMPEDADKSGGDEFIIKTAITEAIEEAGLTLTDTRIVGQFNTNVSHILHSQSVVWGRITGQGEAQPDNLKHISGSRMFTPAEIRVLIDKGEFEDGITLSALAACGIHIPRSW